MWNWWRERSVGWQVDWMAAWCGQVELGLPQGRQQRPRMIPQVYLKRLRATVQMESRRSILHRSPQRNHPQRRPRHRLRRLRSCRDLLLRRKRPRQRWRRRSSACPLARRQIPRCVARAKHQGDEPHRVCGDHQAVDAVAHWVAPQPVLALLLPALLRRLACASGRAPKSRWAEAQVCRCLLELWRECLVPR